MNNNGMVLISMLLVLLFVSIAAALGVQSTTTSVQLSGNYKRIVQAEQAAKSGIRHVGKLLQDQTDLGDAFRVESLDSFDGARGEASPANYGVDVTRWSDLVWHVESTGHSSGPGENAATCTMSALVKRACYPPMSQMLEMSSPAALVTNGSVTVSGSAYISGLEHLEWPPGSGEWYPLWWGTLAALSYGSITSKGAAEYAGMYVDEEGHEQIETGCSLNDDKKGKCSIDNVVHDEQDPDEIPMVRDPDAVLGLDEADPHDKVSDLREIAKSGVNGSQYVTDPAQLGKGAVGHLRSHLRGDPGRGHMEIGPPRRVRHSRCPQRNNHGNSQVL